MHGLALSLFTLSLFTLSLFVLSRRALSRRALSRCAAHLSCMALACVCTPSAGQAPGPDRYSIDQPLVANAGANAGDPVRGRAIVANRQLGLCLLCHTGPIPEERFQGNLAPDLAGAGARWTAGQLRARMVDAGRFNPATIMPAYYRTEGFNRVPAALQGKTLLTAQQIEDVVAYLQTLTSTYPPSALTKEPTP